MKSAVVTPLTASSPARRFRFMRPLITRLLAPLEHADHGCLTLVTPDGEHRRYGDPAATLHAEIRLRRWRAIQRAASGGTLGWSESYVDGDWDSPDISAVVQWALHNEQALGRLLDSGPLKNALARLRHRLRANNPRGSRRNIAYHYDLGNGFYRRWLDETMTYSAALFERPSESLARAQERKYQQIVDALAIRDGASVLEIGCGWGGFAEHLAARQDVSLQGVTLSRQQLAYARHRIAAAGLQDRAAFSLTDYRDVDGSYDHIVSIEMLEAVGEAYWPTYFETLTRLLKPGGSAAIQVITIDDARFEEYRRQPDFIQTHIFPGGMLPSPSRLKEEIGRAGLQLTGEITFGDSYARTLELWEDNFRREWSAIAPQGFDERFQRLWHYYLGYCHGGFRAGSIDVCHLYLRRPPEGC